MTLSDLVALIAKVGDDRLRVVTADIFADEVRTATLAGHINLEELIMNAARRVEIVFEAMMRNSKP